MSLRLQMLPARQGDALWIEWGDKPRRLLVDLGTQAVGSAVRARLLALPRTQRRFELLVVTHVDEDHIGGTLPALVEGDRIDGLDIGDTWFNGWPQLQDAPQTPGAVEAYGPVQGERLGRWLAAWPWNAAFSRGPIAWQPGLPKREIAFADGLQLTVLGPPPARLPAYRETWRREIHEAIRRGRIEPPPPAPLPATIESFGARRPSQPVLRDADDLAALADSASPADASLANATSIVLLLAYRGHRLLLAGDAWGEDLVAAIATIGDGKRLPLSAFKLPHHASESNVSRALVEAVECRDWLVSTDGTRHCHPSAAAIARILRYGTPSPRLHFNVRSEFNGWWDDADWRARFGYEARYGDAADGLTLQWRS